KQLKQILKTWFANRVLATKEGQDDNRNKRLFVVPGAWTGEERTAPAANDLTALARLLAEWKKAIGIEQTSLDHVIKIAADHPSLKAAVLDVAAMDDGQTISNVRLARWLRSFKEVPVGGLQRSGAGAECGARMCRLQAHGQ